jgi:hypothetical protein
MKSWSDGDAGRRPPPGAPPEPAAHSRKLIGPTPLRIAVARVQPVLLSLAFPTDIGVPTDGTGWKQLLDRGAVDVSDSLLRLTLANRSSQPLTVTDIHLELLGSATPPRGAYLYTYTQGDETLGAFAAQFLSKRRGSIAKLYRADGGAPGWELDPPQEPFFNGHFISLAPGEIYHAKLTVMTQLPAMLRYRLAISGSTANGEFAIHDPTVLRVSGLGGFVRGAYRAQYVEGYLAYMNSAAHCETIPVHRWFAVPAKGSAGTCSDLAGRVR